MRSTCGAAAVLLLAFCWAPANAQAQTRWLTHEAEARATLPLPRGNESVAGAALSCDAQKWTLRIDYAAPVPAPVAKVLLGVDGNAFTTKAEPDRGGLAIAVPPAALEPLKAGLRLSVEFPGADEPAETMTFALRGSHLAITAVQERCSHRDMSAYQVVSFTPYSSYIELGRTLRAEDIAAFTTATTARPDVQVAMAEFGQDRRILFTRLCGSSWYFGATGCNITGYGPAPTQTAEGSDDTSDTPPWRVIYDTENVHLFTDPRSTTKGWRDVVTLPARGSEPGQVWRWDADGYVLHGNLPDETDEPDEVNAAPLRGSHD